MPFTYRCTATYTFPAEVESITLDSLAAAIHESLDALGRATGAAESDVQVTLEAEAEAGRPAPAETTTA